MYFELDAVPDAFERATAALEKRGLLRERLAGANAALIVGEEDPSTQWTLTLEGDEDVTTAAHELRRKWPRRAERAAAWDGRFVARTKDLAAALNDFNLMLDIQDTLREVVSGHIFLEWNGQLLEQGGPTEEPTREASTGEAPWPLLDDSQSQTFNGMVRGELDRRKLTYDLEDGVVRLRDGSRTFGLQNLAQACRKVPTTKWSTTVARHFQALFRLQDDESELAAKVRDYDAIESRLRVRLSDREGAKGEVIRQIARGLHAELVLDAPTYLRSVARSEARAWRRSEDALFSVATANTVHDDPGQDMLLAGCEARVVESRSSSYHHASRALGLVHSVPSAERPYGLLFVVPNRHVLGHHVIDDRSMLDAAAAMISLAAERFRDGPGSISPHLYWADRAGRIACVSRANGPTVELDPTPEFARDVLDRFVD